MAVQAATLVKWAQAIMEIGSTAMELKDMVDEAGADFGQAELTVNATETAFTLLWKGTEFDLNHTADISGKTSVEETDAQGNKTAKRVWEWKLDVLEDAGHATDGITISGWVKHLWQPHAIDEPQSEVVVFNMIANADNANRVAVSGSTDTFILDLDSPDIPDDGVIHPADQTPTPEAIAPEPHKDKITKEKITATIQEGGFGGEDFTGYTFELIVEHIGSE